MPNFAAFSKTMKGEFIYRSLRAYVGFLLRHFIFSSEEIEGLEHLPADGTPTLFVGNHQNGLMDPLLLVCTLTDRKVHVFTRGGVFSRGGWINRCAEKIGLIPAYRLDSEGLNRVAQNKEIMQSAGKKMMAGASLLIYPECTHSERCHMAEFSSAYLRMAFDAASSCDFNQEVYVVPVGVHYNGYYGLRNRALIRFGQPVRLSSWYAQYQAKPRTTCLEINHQIHDAVKALVLDIPDELYGYRESLCESRSAQEPILSYFTKNKSTLSEQLALDQAMMRNLDGMSTTCQQELLDEVEQYDTAMKKYGVTSVASQPSHWSADMARNLFALLLLPFGVASLWPGILAYWVCGRLAKKSGSRCFANLYLISIGALVILPVLSIATGIAFGVTLGWLAALTWLVAQPIAYLVAWYYWKEVGFSFQRLNYLKLDMEQKAELEKLHSLFLNVREKLGCKDEISIENITKSTFNNEKSSDYRIGNLLLYWQKSRRGS